MLQHRFPVHRPWLVFVLVAAMMAFAAPAALAATFTVNTTADSSDAGGCTTATVCSLRDAVAAANAAAGSTITVPAGHYTLNTGSSPLGQLAVTSATTITGAGARSTIVDGNGQSRVFDFEPTSATTLLTIQDLTVTGGSAPAAATVTDAGDGAGIFSLGGLDLEHVAVTANTAALGGGGVMDGTIHTMTTPGPATFNGVTIAGNHVQGGTPNGQGGGAVVATQLTMTNSTIAGNSVANAGVNEGGGLVSAVDGGTGATAILRNDTITGNSAAKPVPAPAGDMGGGISGDSLSEGEPYDSAIDATNTIVAGNAADGTEQDCAVIDTSAGTSSHNIQGDATCGFSDSGSKQTTAIDLGPLQNNGGPTDTLLPTASSPAIDAGDAGACPATDQRGVGRPQGAGCDIGSVELAPPTAVTGAATSITPSSASLAGTAGNPAAADGTAVFDYGKTTAYGQTSSAGTVAAGSSGAAQQAILTGLTPNTTYHYRISVTTTDGTATGADATFTTPLSPTALAVSCRPATVMVKHRTVCTATVSNANGGIATAPTGTVKLRSTAKGSSFSGSGVCRLKPPALSSGPSSCSVTYTATGSLGVRTLAAAYGGDPLHAASATTRKVTVRSESCGPPTGSLSGARLGPVKLGYTRSRTRMAFIRYMMRGRPSMDFFCLSGGPGIRVGYLGGRAVLALTSSRHYSLGGVRPNDSLGEARRRLRISSHFRIGLNIWYIAGGQSSSGVLKVRNGRVQEIGIAEKRATQTRASAFRFLSSFPKRA